MSSPGVAGSQGERDRAKEEREREGEKRTEGAEIWQGESVRKARPGMWQERKIRIIQSRKNKSGETTRDLKSCRHSRDCDKPSDRLTGRQSELVLICRALLWQIHSLLEQRRRQGDTTRGIISPCSCTRCLDTRAYT